VFTLRGAIQCSGLVLVVAVGATGCLGSAAGGPIVLGDGAIDGGTADRAPLAFTDVPLPRLSYEEYQATLHDLVTEVLPSDAVDVWSVVGPTAAALPRDFLVTTTSQRHGGLARLDQTIQPEYASAAFAVSLQIGSEMTRTGSRVASLLSGCVTGAATAATLDPGCLTTFIKSFGLLALRRPPSDDDVVFYSTAAPAGATPAAALAQVIGVMLSSPRFLYRVESGEEPGLLPNSFQLDAWELAARLSYQFWGTMPDGALRQAAASGALLSDDGYAAEVARLFADPRTDVVLRNFFRQWMWPLQEMQPLDSRNADPQWKAFAGANLPSPTLSGQMVTEVLDAASWQIAHGGSLKDLLINNQSFARDAELAGIYGVPVWDGTSMPYAFPDDRAGGLLTRAAFVATPTVDTNPIMKGVYLRTGLLCDAVSLPPPNADAVPLPTDPTLPTRIKVEHLTEQDGTVCAGCHKTVINPLGYATESFDSLGRARTVEALFDGTGKSLGTAAIDTSSVPRVTPTDETPSAGAADLVGLLAKSGRVEACFAERFFRFTFRRIEDATMDAAILADVTQLAVGGASLAEVLKRVAMRPEFKQRLIVP
jgi:hypothetical protein